MNTQTTESAYFVMSMTPHSDCRLVGSWLLKAAEAADVLSEMGRDPLVANVLYTLCAIATPDLQAAAMDIVAALRQDTDNRPFHGYDANHVLAVNLDVNENGDFGVEFAMLVQLGFFTLVDGRYQMSVPASVTLVGVEEAVRKVASTMEPRDPAKPELVLHTMAKDDAEAMALKLRKAA